MAKLHFYYSSMNAGKTTTLLQASYNYNERGMDTLLFKPAFDDRDAKGKIASRIGLDAEAVLYDKQFDFYDHTEKAIRKNSNIHCVLVDEAQFINKEQVQQLAKIKTYLKRPVLAYGLRTDFRGEPFEGSKYLLAWAEDIIEIKTICHCGRKATMILRIDENGKTVRTGNQVEIGGNERYISVCYEHFIKGIPKSEIRTK